MNHNWSARKQHLHLQSVAGISRHSSLTCFLKANDVNVVLLCKRLDDADSSSMLSCIIRRAGPTAWKPRSALSEGPSWLCDWDPQGFSPQVESLVSVGWGIRWGTHREGDVDTDYLPSQVIMWCACLLPQLLPGTHSSLTTDGGLRLIRPGCLFLCRGGLAVQRRSHPGTTLNESKVLRLH